METKVLVLCVLLVAVQAAPQPTVLAEQSGRTISEALSTTVNSVNSAVAAVNQLATSAIGAIRQAGQNVAGNVASSTNALFSDSAESMIGQINAIVQTASDSINNIAFRSYPTVNAAAAAPALFPNVPAAVQLN